MTKLTLDIDFGEDTPNDIELAIFCLFNHDNLSISNAILREIDEHKYLEICRMLLRDGVPEDAIPSYTHIETENKENKTMSTHSEIVNRLAEQMRERGFQEVMINEDPDIEFVIDKRKNTCKNLES